ncbi:MAG: SpoIVB peptidase [Oscillospiraceae bacterium]|nr:SpoIVB peptidase [Oscillospiraceae bacterium]
MRRLTKGIAAALLIISLALMGVVGYYDAVLPDTYYVSEGGQAVVNCLFEIEISSGSDVIAASAGGITTEETEAELKLFGVIPVKSAKIVRTDAKMLIPGGSPVGVKLLTDGVMVVKTAEVTEGISPAYEAGIRAGDNIISANGEKLNSSARLSEIIENSQGEEITLTVMRNGKTFTAAVTPVYSEIDGVYKAGLWIRDSTAGVGTLTFIDPETGIFGALGHPISDSDTLTTLPLGSGEIVDVVITGYDRGERGCPGELYGTFVSGLASGTIELNCEQGIFGAMTYPSRQEAIPIAYKAEVRTGPATILTTIDGSTPQEFEIEIERVTLSSSSKSKNIIIKVTDPELLELTGGIVQGMSGSPIIQDGKLVGAVTHVFVSDPTRGYGIFIENMLDATEILTEENLAA